MEFFCWFVGFLVFSHSHALISDLCPANSSAATTQFQWLDSQATVDIYVGAKILLEGGNVGNQNQATCLGNIS